MNLLALLFIINFIITSAANGMELHEIVVKSDKLNSVNQIPIVCNVPTLKALAARCCCKNYAHQFENKKSLVKFVEEKAGQEIAEIIRLYQSKQIEEGNRLAEFIRLKDYKAVMAKLPNPVVRTNIHDYTVSDYERYCRGQIEYLTHYAVELKTISDGLIADMDEVFDSKAILIKDELLLIDKLKDDEAKIASSKNMLNQLLVLKKSQDVQPSSSAIVPTKNAICMVYVMCSAICALPGFILLWYNSNFD